MNQRVNLIDTTLVRLESLTYFDTEAKQKEVKNIEKRVSRKDATTQRKGKKNRYGG